MIDSKEWLKIAKDIEWDRYAVRQFTFFFWSQVLDSYHNYQEFIGDKFNELMVKYSSKGKIYFRPAKKTKELHTQTYKKLKDIEFVEEFVNKAEKQFDEMENCCNEFFEKDLSKYEDKKLIDEFDKYYQIVRLMLPASSTTIIMIDQVTNYVQDKILRPKLKEDDKSINELMSDISVASEIIHYTQEELDLIGIAEERNNSNFDKLLKNHIDKYDKMHFFSTNELWSKEKFIKRLNNFEGKDLEKEKNKIEKGFAGKNKRIEEIIKKYNFSKDEIKYVEYLRRLLFVRTREEYILSLIEYVHHMMFTESSKRYPVAVSQFNFFTIHELYDLFAGKDVDMDKVNQRKELSLQVYHNQDTNVFVGKEAEELLDKLVPDEIIKDFDGTLEGASAMKGHVKGKVKLILHPNDLEKFEDGDILVAPNTNPSYVVAMKKAGAIVTDEGGVTCHAAIVSRELGIPCVIGTKFATEVFEDDDEVEVDAERGLVKKL